MSDVYCPPEGYVTMGEAQRRLGVSKVTIVKIVRDAGIKTYRDPRNGRVRLLRRAHRDRQNFARAALAEAWSDYGLVFTTQLGTAFLAADVSHKFKRAVMRAGLPKSLRFHDLRHANGTAMLRAGIHPKAASARLGHSSISITMDLYTHAVRELDAEAAAKLDAVFARPARAS